MIHDTRRLYIVRAAIALVWAGALTAALSSSGSLSPHASVPAFAAVLFVLYPVIDIAASLLDARTQHLRGAVAHAQTQWLNAAIGTVTVVSLAVAVPHGPAPALRVFGGWAVLSGLLQLALAVSRIRRGVRGQWPMSVSGGISTAAGTSFIVSASRTTVDLRNAAGYAAFGAVLFIFSALRLRTTDVPGA